ncbi:MAG: sigma-70 family RNA polymerase sigma factor [Candidatus Riflebacteria bacterium]|nr:sigma-70 family RNA polymerase sigma factor [Candidatus Riflebacteria bacterium]
MKSIISFFQNISAESDEKLVEQATQGSGASFEKLVQRHYNSIFRLALFKTGNRETAMDIVQDTFVRAFKYLSSYKPSGKFQSWLFQITRNKIHDFYKEQFKSRQLQASVPDEILNNISSSVNIEEEVGSRSEVESLLQGLSESEREIMVLRFTEGLSYSEISQITGKSEAGLRQTICRAIRALGKKEKQNEL